MFQSKKGKNELIRVSRHTEEMRKLEDGMGSYLTREGGNEGVEEVMRE